MASSAEFRRIFQSAIASPQDALNALDGLEDVCHEAVSEVQHQWGERGPGRPWKALATAIGRCRVAAKKRLYKMGAVD